MSEIYDKYLTVEQQKKIKAIPDERRWNNYRNFDLELEVWDSFWENTFKWESKETPEVLDYGCGAAYDEIVAKKLKKANVTSLDIDTKEVRIVFGRFHEVTGVSAKYWNGETMPFDDNSFDAIISKASLSKLVNSPHLPYPALLIKISKLVVSKYDKNLFNESLSVKST